MQGGEPVRICAVNNFEHLVILIKVLLGKCENFDNFRSITLIYLGPIIHLDFFYVLLSIFLRLWLLAFARVTFDWLIHLVYLWILRIATKIWLSRISCTCTNSHIVRFIVIWINHLLQMLLLAVVGKLIGLLIVIIIANIDVYVVLRVLPIIILCVLLPVIHRTFGPWIPSIITHA